jgi:hypothetical protein
MAMMLKVAWASSTSPDNAAVAAAAPRRCCRPDVAALLPPVLMQHWTDAMVDPGSVLAAVCMAAKVVKAAYDWMEQKERNTNASGQLQERGAEAQLRLKYIKEHVDTEDEVLAGVLKRGIDQVIKALAAAGEIMEKYSSKNK